MPRIESLPNTKYMFLLQQAILPLSIYLPLMLFLVSIMSDLSFAGAEEGLQYYNMLSSMPTYWPAAVNPIIAILMIRPYRQTFFATFLGCLTTRNEESNQVQS